MARKANHSDPQNVKMAMIRELLGGLLSSDPQMRSEMETLLATASDETLEAARATIMSVKRALVAAQTQGQLIGPGEVVAEAYNQREFACLLLVNGILLNEKGPKILEKFAPMT